MIGRPIGELSVGVHAEVSRLVTPRVIAEFVEAVGDENPLHSDETFAATTPIGKPVAPGIWTAGVISGVLGTQLPGPGSLYISQELSFLKPVFLGDTITAHVEVVEVRMERNRVRLKTLAINQRGEEVLVGEAWVKPPKTRVVYTERVGVSVPAFVQPWFWGAAALNAWSAMGRSILAKCHPVADDNA